MSMTLQDMTHIDTLTRNASSSSNPASATIAASKSDPLSKALDSANKRTSAQISQTNVQLSSYGQIKSGFSSLQSTGQALTTLAKNASAGDVTRAAQNFVAAYNATNSAVGTTVNGSGKNPGALANAPLVGITSNDLRRVVSGSTGSAELRNIGITVNQNGALSVDSGVFASALQNSPDSVNSTLAKIGQQASATAANELSSGGPVGSAVNSLNNRVKTLAAQQISEQNIAASAQATIQQNTYQTPSNGSFSTGVSAYIKMFSL